MTVTAHVTINASKSAVWKAITDIPNAAGIIRGIQKVEILDEPSAGLVGLKWRETRMYFDKPAAIDKWITEAVENSYYKTWAEMDGFIFLTTMTITESGSGILLESAHETRSEGIVAKIKSLPMVLFKGVLRKAIQQDLDDIKKAVEGV